MSAHKHATISAWQRNHDESGYTAEINGWTLRVKWHAESDGYLTGNAPLPGGERRGFSWEVEKEGARKMMSSERYEEIELAMVAAETQVGPAPADQKSVA
jgi:hypothetical protein